MKHPVLLIIFVFSLCFNGNTQISFEDQASDLGLGTACGTTFLGNGVTFYDFDQDGWDDITLNTETGQPLRFYKNINGNFQEVTLNIPVINYQTKQVNWVDFDNDGDKDLFVTSNSNGNKLFENTGDLNFQDITFSSGLYENNMFSYGASWGDYNNDGLLDVFISNRTSTVRNKLYKNNGDGTFEDVGIAAGILSPAVESFCAAFLDINNDGFQDIYVTNDKTNNSNVLYKNNGDGTFTDISISSGTNVSIDAMTVTVGDYNNDGWFDIYITNNPSGNVLYRNNGDETFTNVAASSGTIFNSISWGASFFDADNDMDVDLYVCGMFDATEDNFIRAAFYENNGDETFNLSNSSFPGDDRAGFSSAIADTDNDGFLELVVSNNNDQNLFLWKNTTTNSNNWLKVNLEGTLSNKDGIGSIIEMSVNGNKYYRYTLNGEGYLSQNSRTQSFGLGTNLVVDYLKVSWLSGLEDVFYNVSANQVLDIVEGSNPLSVTDFEFNESIRIYPNPVQNMLYIDAQSYIIEAIEFYTILGKRQELSILPNSNSIDVSFLESGIYFVEIKTKETKQVLKFIKL